MSDGKFKSGVSGNPKGRPRGIVDKRMRLNQALMADADALLQVTKAKAMEGDMTAMALLLSRAVPTLKAESAERVQFAFDSSKPLSDQIAAITQAAADGELTLEQAHQFTELAKALATVRAMEGGGDRESALINAFKEFAKVCPA